MDRKQHWEAVYGSKQPQQLSWYQKEPGISLALIRNTGIRRDAAIIDVGGGDSVLVDRLLDGGFSNLSVLDISGTAIARCRNRMGPDADAVNWIETDVTEFNPAARYMLWHDRAVFHFLTDADDRQKYISALRRGLQEGGHFVVATFAIGGPLRCSGLDIVQYDADKLLGELGEGFTLKEERIEHHITPGGADQKFAWFHFRREATAPE